MGLTIKLEEKFLMETEHIYIGITWAPHFPFQVYLK